MGLLVALCGVLLISIVLLLLFWFQAQRTLQRIQVHGRNANDVSLARSPTRLSPFELVSITVAILNKYVLVFIGKAARLRADPERDQSFALPSILVHGLLEINNDDFEKFRNAVPHNYNGPANTNAVSPFFLIATTGPLVPYILAHPNCPIKPLGAVNTRNTFVIHDARFCRDIQAIKDASAEGQISYTAAFGGPDRPGQRRQRGVEFLITIKILWNGGTVLSQELGFLQFLSSSTLPEFKRPIPSVEGRIQTPDQSFVYESSINDSDLRMSSQHPREWAACCRDYNPIHVSVFMAKLFGFRSVIAHGNHAVALVIQQLYNDHDCGENHIQTMAKQNIWESRDPVTIDVKFVKPMVLPVLARVRWYDSGERKTQAAFEIYKGSAKYTVGSCST